MRTRIPALAAVIVAFGLVAAQCEPQLTLPSYIRTVAVPTFENLSRREGIEFDVTQRVLHEFLTTSELAVVPDPEYADAVVHGTITDYTRRPISYDQNGDIVQYKIAVVVDVSFEDRVGGNTLWTAHNVDGITTYSLLTVPPESEDDAIFRASDELARDILYLVIEGRQYTEDDLLFTSDAYGDTITPGDIRR